MRRSLRLTARAGRVLFLVAPFVLSMVPAAPARAQDGQARLGGGSDIAGGQVVLLPQGGRVPPIHFVFADNPEDSPIRVAFRAQSRRGIEIVPTRRRFTIRPHDDVTARFAIRVSKQLPPRDYRVTVQLVRTDIRPTAGGVTNVPAVGTRFTVRVTGRAGSVVVRATERDRRPVKGTLVLSAISESGAAFEVDRALASTLTARVAPGRYEATYMLADRKLASERIDVRAGESENVTLVVETVSFVVASAKPVAEGGRIVVANLVASVQNQLDAISGDIRVRARVLFGRREVGNVVLRDLDTLPLGLTDAKTTYRPEGGWRPGTYVFEFEVVTPDFTFQAAERPSIDVPRSSSAAGAALAAAAVAVLAFALGGYVVWRRRRAR